MGGGEVVMLESVHTHALYHASYLLASFHRAAHRTQYLRDTQANSAILKTQSSPRPSSPLPSQREAGGAPLGSSTGRPSSPTPPGGPKTAIRRRAAADQKDKVANVRPSSTRAAGAGGSSSTMLSRSFECFLFLLL